jgi:hypothetical protein
MIQAIFLRNEDIRNMSNFTKPGISEKVRFVVGDDCSLTTALLAPCFFVIEKNHSTFYQAKFVLAITCHVPYQSWMM